MLHRIISRLDSQIGFETASAHCDIPCKIYDPISAQLAALTVIRMVDLLEEQAGKEQNMATQNTVARLIAEKEEHGTKVKNEIQVIWGDYIKTPQLEAYPELHELTHSIMLAASKAKQHVDKAAALDLLTKVNRFAEIFWATKGVDTFSAECPYPPAQQVVYPKLG